jgi:hypothetical protein
MGGHLTSKQVKRPCELIIIVIITREEFAKGKFTYRLRNIRLWGEAGRPLKKCVAALKQLRLHNRVMRMSVNLRSEINIFHKLVP